MKWIWYCLSRICRPDNPVHAHKPAVYCLEDLGQKMRIPIEVNHMYMYIQHLLRQHLHECLLARELSTFPKTSKRAALRWGQEVFQICWLLEGGEMVQYNSCHDSFHDNYVPIPQYVWKKPKSQWFCASCTLCMFVSGFSFWWWCWLFIKVGKECIIFISLVT